MMPSRSYQLSLFQRVGTTVDTLVSKDILSRWTFPLVPDDNYPGGDAYDHLRGNKYIPKDNSVVLSRSVPERVIVYALASL